MSIQASVHRRSVVLGEDGIATVTVRMEGVATDEPIVLATLSKPFTCVEFEPVAIAHDGEQLPVERIALRRGAVAAVARAYRGRTFDSLTWRFRVSNAYPLIQRDLVVPRPSYYQTGAVGYAGRSCVLRVRSGELWQSVRVESADTVLQRRNAVGRVEARKPHWHGLTHDWETVGEHKLEPDEGDGALTVRFVSPVCEQRYAITFAPLASPRHTLAQSEWRQVIPLLDEAASLRRSNDERAATLQQALIASLHRELRHLYRSDQTEIACTSTGMLWDHGKKQLRVVYGDCPIEQWGEGFDYGQGVAGHAFRFGEEATYHAGKNRTLIYQERGGESDGYAWLACVPLRYRSTCIGVVCFSGFAPSRDSDRVSEQIRALTKEGEKLAETQKSQLGALTWRVNCAFWESLANSDRMLLEHRALASSCLAELVEQRPLGSSNRPQASPSIRPAPVVPASEASVVVGPAPGEQLASTSEPTKTSNPVQPDPSSLAPPPNPPPIELPRKSNAWLGWLMVTVIPAFLASPVVLESVKVWLGRPVQPSPTPTAVDHDISKQDVLELLRKPEGTQELRELRATAELQSLHSIDLSGRRLPGAPLWSADLTEANLHASHLTGADLSDAKLCRANLRGADLHAANLTRADLSDADLSDANLDDAVLDSANLSGTDLRSAQGLAQEDLTGACGDADTKLPAGLTVRPCIN